MGSLRGIVLRGLSVSWRDCLWSWDFVLFFWVRSSVVAHYSFGGILCVIESASWFYSAIEAMEIRKCNAIMKQKETKRQTDLHRDPTRHG